MSEPTLPAGYVDLNPGFKTGFGASLGQVFVNEAEQKIAFYVRPEHLNVAGSLHGGAIATLADTQIVAVKRLADLSGKHTPTVSLSVDYLAPVRAGALVEMQVSLVRRAGTLLFTQAMLVVENEIVARTQAIYRHFDRPLSSR